MPRPQSSQPSLLKQEGQWTDKGNPGSGPTSLVLLVLSCKAGARLNSGPCHLPTITLLTSLFQKDLALVDTRPQHVTATLPPPRLSLSAPLLSPPASTKGSPLSQAQTALAASSHQNHSLPEGGADRKLSSFFPSTKVPQRLALPLVTNTSTELKIQKRGWRCDPVG